MVYQQNGVLGHAIAPSLFELLSPFKAGHSRLLIDMPLVLLNKTSQNRKRPCDVAARKLLGRKSASVFSPPAEEALVGKNYREACQLNQEVNGKKISLQTWYLFPKIKDLRLFLNEYPDWKCVVMESHLELVFQRFNDLKPLSFSKKTVAGIDERLAILERIEPSAKTFYQETYQATERKQVAPDDLLDAMALAIRAKLGDFSSFGVYEESSNRPKMDYFF